MNQKKQNLDSFYYEILDDFKNRMFLAYRYKSNISQDLIDKFNKTVEAKMKRHDLLFKSGTEFALKKRDHPETVQDNVKIEELEDDQYSVKGVQLHEDKQQQEQDEDDLKQFEPQQPTVKVQEKQQKQQAKEENISDHSESQSQEDRKKQQILNKVGTRFNAHIIATYSAKNKKHIPKDEKTKIDLQNVFIRTNDRQFYYSKLQCDFHQIDYSDINLP